MESSKHLSKTKKVKKVKKVYKKILADPKIRKAMRQPSSRSTSPSVGVSKKKKVKRCKVKRKKAQVEVDTSEGISIPPQKLTVTRATTPAKPVFHKKKTAIPKYPDIPTSVIKRMKKPVNELEKLKKDLVKDMNNLEESMRHPSSPTHVLKNVKKKTGHVTDTANHISAQSPPSTRKTVKTKKLKRLHK